MYALNIFAHGSVIVDPHNQYNLKPEEVSRFLHNSMGELTNWFSEMDFKDDPLDRIWEWYQFGEPSTDNSVQIINNLYHYPDDPILDPLVSIVTEAKGYSEEFLIYPSSFVAYLKNGDLVSHGRMD